MVDFPRRGLMEFLRETFSGDPPDFSEDPRRPEGGWEWEALVCAPWLPRACDLWGITAPPARSITHLPDPFGSFPRTQRRVQSSPAVPEWCPDCRSSPRFRKTSAILTCVHSPNSRDCKPIHGICICSDYKIHEQCCSCSGRLRLRGDSRK